MEKNNTFIQNFATFTAYDGGGKVKVILNEAGEEAGFEVRGTLTKFDVRNENGYIFTRESYDKFVDNYYEANRFNVPLVIYHNDWDPRFVCGIVKEMKKTEEGVEMVGFVPRSAYFYNLIKSQIEDGIIQGFSNAGFIVNAKLTEDENEVTSVLIKEFALMHASMVTIPADTSAKFKVENTAFSGFGNEEPKVENKKDNSEDWDTIV